MNEVKLGVVFKRSKKETKKDEDLKSHLLAYDKTKLFEFLDKLMVIFETDKKLSNKTIEENSDSD